MLWTYEITDTFAGEANYAWVDRGELKAGTVRGIVRKLKAKMGVTGRRAETYNGGSFVEVRPVGKNAPCVIATAHFER